MVASTSDIQNWRQHYGFRPDNTIFSPEHYQWWNNHNLRRTGTLQGINNMPFVMGPEQVHTGGVPKTTDEIRSAMYPNFTQPNAPTNPTQNTFGLDAQTSELLRQILELPNLSSLLEQLIMRSGGGERAGGGFGGTGGSPGG